MSVEKAKELISKRDEIDSQLIELHQVYFSIYNQIVC